MSNIQSLEGSISALLLTIMTGALSLISSCIIIYIIYKSEKKLSTIYHRIMCGMSIADIIKCIAVIFVTLPMPREFAEGVENYGWTGVRLGNMGTCEAQGFLFTFGSVSMYAYYISLIGFYTITLGFNIREGEGTIERCFEPVFHLIPIAFALGISLYNYVEDSYRPNAAKTFCSAVARKGGTKKRFVIFAGILLGYIIICFILIIIAVRRNQRYVVPPTLIRRGGSYRGENNLSSAIRSFNPTKVIFIQASAYIVAFLLMLGVPSIASFVGFHVWLYYIALFFLICQGIFNALIFVSHKVYNYRRINQNKSIREVIFMLFRGDAHDDIYISRMTFVDRDIYDVRLQRQEDLELIERIQDEDSISIENNDDSDNRNANNFLQLDLTPTMFPIQEVSEDQEDLHDSIVCFDSEEEERSDDLESQMHSYPAWKASTHSDADLSTHSNTDLNGYSWETTLR